MKGFFEKSFLNKLLVFDCRNKVGQIWLRINTLFQKLNTVDKYFVRFLEVKIGLFRLGKASRKVKIGLFRLGKACRKCFQLCRQFSSRWHI